MLFKSIQLIQYRNYSDAQFPLSRVTLFIGSNGSGKTNVIEAIRTLSVTKSYRVNQDKDAIQWGKTYCRALLKSDESELEYVLTIEGGITKKVIKNNGVAIPLTEVYGLVPTVLFSPETMQLIDGAPLERRRFVDTLLSQVDRDYLEALMTYRKILRERHFVLLRIQSGLGNSDELDYWDQELERKGLYIMEQRHNLIQELNLIVKETYASFLEGTEQSFIIAYRPTCELKEWGKVIRQSRGYDIKTGTTRHGPHRDEFVFLLDDRNVTLFASRGELRRCVLATKIAEATYLKNRKQKDPILLLDDVFSEFDALRRSRLKGAIQDYQTVITTTDESFARELELENPLIHLLPAKTN